MTPGMAMSHTYTRTVNTIEPANPFLRCSSCGAVIDHFSHVGDGQGPIRNQPCDHSAGYESVCPSWSPVDGCVCAAHLGHIPH